MATRTEARLCKNILLALSDIPNSYWERIEQTSVRGTADIIGCIRGDFYWIEVKVKFTETPAHRERLQLYKMGKVLEAGGSVMQINTDNWRWQCERLKRKYNSES